MPLHPIHLAQTATARGWAKSVGTSEKDAQVINGLFEVATNQLLGTKTVYVTKRAGSSVSESSIATTPILLKFPAYGGMPPYIAVSGDGNGTLKNSSTTYGAVGGQPSVVTNYQVADSIVGTNQVIGFTISTNGYYLWEDAISTNFPTFTGNRTSGSAVISGIASTTGIYPGQIITGTGIPGSTYVLTVDSSTQITMSQNATSGAGTSTTISKEAVAKIIDADFPSTNLVGGMVSLDGYFFVCNSDGKISQSAINDPSSWATTDTINADYSGDGLLFIFKLANYIVAAGNGGTVQYFYNAGNPTGSVLSAAQNLTLSGITLANAPVPVGGEWYCRVNNSAGHAGVRGLYKITGVNTFTKVSDDIWDQIIQDLALTLISPCYIGNKRIVVLHSSTATVSVAYDPSVNHFSFIQLASAFTSAASHGGLFTRASSNDILLWEPGNTWTDEGAAYTLTIQTEPQDMAQGFSCTDIWADLLADNESSGTTTLSTIDDDSTTWVSRGSFDMTATKKRIHALGYHNVRSYRLQHSANTGWRGQVLRINFQPATV